MRIFQKISSTRENAKENTNFKAQLWNMAETKIRQSFFLTDVLEDNRHDTNPMR